MIFDHIEWDEHNLDHATRRLTAAEIEQAIWNADRMFPHREHPDRALFRVGDRRRQGRRGHRRDRRRRSTTYHRMGGVTMAKKSEAELADYYNETQDVSEFDLEHPESITVRRNVTISVRFSDKEIEQLRLRAEEAGVKVTSFIRAAALEATSPVDRAALGELARDLEQRAHQVAEFVARGA